MIANKEPIKVYRIENPNTTSGMWYNEDGSYSGFIHTLTDGKCAGLPMDRDEKYRKDGFSWFSAAKSVENMNQWFSVMDAYELDKQGYFLYEFEVSQYWTDDIQAYFTREGQISKRKIQLSEVFDLGEIKYSKVMRDGADESQYAIKGFFGKYRPLSNFDATPFEIDGVKFKTGEHAFHYYKTFNKEWKQKILDAKTPSEAKKLGRQCPMREDWEKNKAIIIRDILFNKFEQNNHLKELLLSTEYKYLEETNDWGDTYWGVCNGVGRNELGRALMFIRSELMTQNYSHWNGILYGS